MGLNGVSPSNQRGVEKGRNGPPDRCLYCDWEQLRPRYSGIHDRLGYAPGPWGFVFCDACGSAILSPFPPADRLADFYPPIYSFAPELNHQSAFRRRWSQLETKLVYRRLYLGDARRVLRHTRPGCSGSPRLLDLGCGRGLRLQAFRALGCEVLGTDFQPEVVAYVRDQLGIPALCATLEDLPALLAPDSFDVLTAYYLFEHVVDVSDAVRTCLTLLRPGGWLAAAVPLVDSVQSRMLGARWCQVTEAPRHVSVPSRKGLLAAAQRAGFCRAQVVPDSLRLSAASLALSLVPAGTTHGTYTEGRKHSMPARLAALAIATMTVPWCWLENRVLRRPALGILFAQRPMPDESAAHPAEVAKELLVDG